MSGSCACRGASMSGTKQLLEKIAALRVRLSQEAPTVRKDAAPPVEEKARVGAWHNSLIDGTLRPLEARVVGQEPPLPTRLTARGGRLLRTTHELLQALREIAADPVLPDDETDPLAVLHREAAGMLEV